MQTATTGGQRSQVYGRTGSVIIITGKGIPGVRWVGFLTQNLFIFITHMVPRKEMDEQCYGCTLSFYQTHVSKFVLCCFTSHITWGFQVNSQINREFATFTPFVEECVFRKTERNLQRNIREEERVFDAHHCRKMRILQYDRLHC